MRHADARGFTLIEMLLVVALISILAAMIVPRFTGRSEEAKVAAATADIQANIAGALDLYELDNGRFPDTLQDLLANPGPEKAKKWRGPYLKKKRGLKDPWGNAYVYRPGPNGTRNSDYDLFSPGPDGSEGGADDIVNWETEEAAK
jgi:general secretion pathway protein G